MYAFSDLALAVYCPRKLYYRRRDDRDPPDAANERRALAFEYETLLADDAPLERRPIDGSPDEFRTNLERTRKRLDCWDRLVDPARRNVLLTGRECRGVAHKVLDTPLVPSVVSTGSPPDEGVWEPQSVRAVAAAKALSWEEETPVERAFVEYPAHGVIRTVSLTTRRKAAYRRAIRTLEAIDGPPPRLQNDAKCESCEYREQCGARSRSLRSLLGI